jgi:hypothetical protein
MNLKRLIIVSLDLNILAGDIPFNVLHTRAVCYDILCISLTSHRAAQSWMGEDTRETIDHQSTFEILI